MNKRVVIVGSGLGGLECGYILAKQGYNVTVLEKEHQTGGCLQTFVRGGRRFDTGFHYVGGLGEGESLRPLFDYFGLMDLPWKRLDEDCFDEVVYGDKAYRFAQGHERFVETLAADFPMESAKLERYAALLKNVGDHIWDSLSPRDADAFYSQSLFAKSAWEWLCETIDDPTLRQVLGGTALKMELDRDRLPLYVFAQINNSFIQSAWRLQGGGSQIADRLTEEIEQLGGRVRTRAEVTELIEKDGVIAEVEINGEERIPCDWVISDAHPALTLSLVKESAVLRGIYRRRIANLKNSVGMFTMNIRLKENTLPYLNKNLYIHRGDADLWQVQTTPIQSALVHFYPPEDGGKWAQAVDILCQVELTSDLSQKGWGDSEEDKGKPMHRSVEYEAYKAQKADELLAFVSGRLPELRGAIEQYWTSTPLTYEYYTGTWQGSAYGITKDWQSPMTTVLTPRTPIANLLLTGQSLNLHGILGTSMTSLFTTAEIIGKETIRKELKI